MFSENPGWEVKFFWGTPAKAAAALSAWAGGCRNLLSNMAPLLMFEGRRMTNEENHTRADTCVHPVLSGILLRHAHAFWLALQTKPLAHTCFRAQISSNSLAEIESRTFLCDPLTAWCCSHVECCTNEKIPNAHSSKRISVSAAKAVDLHIFHFLSGIVVLGVIHWVTLKSSVCVINYTPSS